MRLTELGVPYWLLIPERQDSRPEFGNGQVHQAGVVLELMLRLQRLAGGATRGLGRAEVRGIWASIEDTSIRFEVALTEDKEPELIGILEWAAREFGQECLYAVLGGGRRAVLVYREGGDADPAS